MTLIILTIKHFFDDNRRQGDEHLSALTYDMIIWKAGRPSVAPPQLGRSIFRENAETSTGAFHFADCLPR
jgi:hypothetical protein